jgi:hypothetical protein
MISKFFISTFICSAFFFNVAFTQMLNHKSNAFDACANDKSESEKYQTSLCITLITTFSGTLTHSTACFKADKLLEPSDFKINLNSVFSHSSAFADNFAIKSCTADCVFLFDSCSLIKETLCSASCSFFTTSTILPASGKSVIQSI